MSSNEAMLNDMKIMGKKIDGSLKYITVEGLNYICKKINERMNDIVTKGIHNCASCGAPYTGKPICEYCGRGFFVNFNYTIGERK